MAKGWTVYRDCPHEEVCLNKKECAKRDKKGEPTRDGPLENTRTLDIREQWFDPAFGDEGDE